MKKYVIDIDGTICRSDGAYDKSQPIINRIAIMNNKYNNGDYIIYYTARGMGTSSNNRDAAYDKYYHLTKNQLNDWGVKYHELWLGKPSGDVYIDDRGINATDFFGDEIEY